MPPTETVQLVREQKVSSTGGKMFKRRSLARP